MSLAALGYRDHLRTNPTSVVVEPDTVRDLSLADGAFPGSGLLRDVGTLAPFTLFAFGQSRVAPQIAGAFVNFEPLVGAAVGMVVLGDAFGTGQGVGCAAILAGIALSAWTPD